eukprot:6182739-Pleurochrysis_carterae.AAC.1
MCTQTRTHAQALVQAYVLSRACALGYLLVALGFLLHHQFVTFRHFAKTFISPFVTSESPPRHVSSGA